MNWLTLPQDRDFTPYAYPAVFKVPYLKDGHVDIKPPLIHWSYKCWASISGTWQLKHQTAWLRSMPLAGMICSAILLMLSGHMAQSFVLLFLLASPTLWAHMANTEWLSVLLISLALVMVGCGPCAWICLGLLPWANQKNALLIAPVAWALGLHISWTVLLLFAPSVALLSYLAATKRLESFLYHCVVLPSEFGVKRTFKKNTLGQARLLIPCLALLATILATGQGRWLIVALVAFLTMLWSKQIMPHHFLLLALPIALASQPSYMMWIAVFLIWIPRDGICWWRQDLIYKFTFGGGNADYGTMMADAHKIEAWIRENTATDELIWVNGMENQIYLNTHRKAWRLEIPELEGVPEGETPRVIVHCHQSCKKFDYTGYRSEVISTIGLYTLMVK